MLKKIITIKNIGKFKDYQYEGDVELRKLNIIYANNGRGKTTLVTILRSLKNNDPSIIEGRRTLSSSQDPYVKLLFDHGDVIYKDMGWSEEITNFKIFDETFISENVFSGNLVSPDHKRNLYRFVVGSKGVTLTKKIDDLDRRNREKAQEIRDMEGELRKHFSGDVDINDFLSLDQVEEKELEEKHQEITTLRTANFIAKKETLKEISLPIIPTDKIKTKLSASIEEVSKKAARRVKDHISHCMDEGGEHWIEKGIGFIKDDKCPFCGESILDNDLVDTYRSYFDKAYKSFKRDIHGFLENITSLFSEDELIAVQGTIAENAELVEFWNDHIETSFPEIDFQEGIQTPWQSVRNEVARLIELKVNNPLEEYDIDKNTLKVIKDYHNIINNEVEEYNRLMKMTNGKISSLKDATEEGDLDQAMAEFESLKLRETRYEPEVVVLCDQYIDLCDEKDDLETAKEEAKKELDDFSKEIMGNYGPSINQQLANCGTGFKIVELDKNYIGGSPRTDYCLQIDGSTVDLGSEDVPIDEPSFKNTLSSGDKSALAFSFFMAALKQDANVGDNIVVVDDPASSLDSQRLSYTCHQIAWLSRNCKQVIVLTHNAGLARDIWENAKFTTTPKVLWIKRVGKYSTIEQMNIKEVTRSNYSKNYFDLVAYLENGPLSDSHKRSVAKLIRPTLEGYYRVKFPLDFTIEERLGTFIEKIEQTEKGDRLFTLKRQMEELSEINHFASKYHHDQNPHADTELIDDTELSSYIRRSLEIIGQSG